MRELRLLPANLIWPYNPTSATTALAAAAYAES